MSADQDQGHGKEKIGCNETCGCEMPCLGGNSCRCYNSKEIVHVTCCCGSHCACADCTCGAVPADAPVGKEGCMCGVSCTCLLCHA